MAQLGCQNEFAPDNLSRSEKNQHSIIKQMFNEIHQTSQCEFKLIIFSLSFSTEAQRQDLKICGLSNRINIYQH